MTALRRTRIGAFNVAAAADIYGADPPPAKHSTPPAVREVRAPRVPVDPALRDLVNDRIIGPAQVARASFDVRLAAPEEETDIGYGRALGAVGLPGTYAVLDQSGERFLALMAEEHGSAKAVMVWQAH
nr:hypothetical protein [Nakamurella antarctica]